MRRSAMVFLEIIDLPLGVVPRAAMRRLN